MVTLVAKTRRTDRIIPVQATVGGTISFLQLSGITYVSNTDISVLTYNTSTGGFEFKPHNYMDHTPGVLTANSAILVDANSHIDYLNVTNFRIQSSGANTSYIDEIVESITASANNNQLATSLAIKTYVDEAVKDISGLNNPVAIADGGTGQTTFGDDGIVYVSNSTILDSLVGSNGDILQWDANAPTFSSVLDGGSY